MTCVYEFWQRDMGAWERNVLIGMYGGYAVICKWFRDGGGSREGGRLTRGTVAAMGTDMFIRIQKTLRAATEGGEKKKQ